MRNKKRARQFILAALLLSAAGSANAVWLAADPGTIISVQLNRDGVVVVRPIGGTWSHPVCPDVTAAEVTGMKGSAAADFLIAAVANGLLVNVNALADECDEHGHPIIRNVRVQAP